MIRWIVILQVLLHGSLCAQQDSIDLMQAIGPEVSIEGAISAYTLLAARPSDHSAADLLATHSGIQIQSQGSPYLRTALYRGQSARHMAILWEGVNIQNRFNGTYDLGLIPTTMFDRSKWYDGGHSAAVGTAAMSGALVLDRNNNRPFVSAGILYSDMSNRRLNLDLHHQVGRYSQSIQANFIDNENTFRYQSRDEVLRRKNSQHSQLDLSYQAHMQWSKDMRTKINYWYQDVNRMLAPSVIATNLAGQVDRNHRISLGHDWQYSPKVYWSTKLAYMNEYLAYRQPGIESIANSDIVNFNTKVKVEGRIDHTIGVAIRYEDGELVDTISPLFKSFYPDRTTSAIYYNGTLKADKTTVSLSLRQEAIDDDIQSPTGQIAIKYESSDQVSYALHLGRHYSYPGFNDLYWPSGGNSNLIAEKSWQVEGKLTLYGWNVNLYHIRTTDKILWAPNTQGVWTPENIASTSSTGVEIKYNATLNIGKDIAIQINPIFNYNKTINTTEGANEGNELLYNPRINWRLNTVLQYKQLALSVNESYTGRRYQTLDNVGVLNAYSLLNAELNYRWRQDQKYSTELYVGSRNIIDENYELVRFFPQPLRSIYIGVNFSIQ